jgi:imidazolonepropionase-like amidohydrolase
VAGTAPMTDHASSAPLLIQNALLFDGVSAELRDGASVLVERGHIREVADAPLRSAVARTIDLGGRFLMPGLIDAHFHAYGAALDVGKFDRMPLSLLAHHGATLLEAALMRGFTAVRDAAGADYGLSRAVDLGLIRGPRVFFAGRALSQTGGHGDLRSRDEVHGCGCRPQGVMSVLVDGEDEVRRAAREELRMGAHQLKIMVSGGVLSPTDPVWMPQFTDVEIRAAVQEAASRRTYVMAHAHTAEAALRCVAAGVRSIEHGSFIDDVTARAIAAAGAWVVPTLVIVERALAMGKAEGMPATSLQKMAEIEDSALHAFESCTRHGVRIGFGTDLLGALHRFQNREFVIRREIAPALDILRSATSGNAALLQQEGKLGTITEGACADLLAVDANPLDDIAVLEDLDQLVLIIKDGKVVKDSLH